MKPTVFIGSSRESLDFAWAVQVNLEQPVVGAEASVWTQSIFELSKCTIESLVLAVNRFDFGIFIFGADDVIRMRGFEYPSARDNVVFELGLFIGKLGRDRSFILVPKGDDDFHLPTDLLGITYATFDAKRDDKNHEAAVAPACNKIAKLMQMQGPVVPDPKAHGNGRTDGYHESPFINQLINSAIHAACRAVALPQTPGAAKIRVFVFRKEGAELVCSHSWAQHPTKESIGKLRFKISLDKATDVGVVRCVLEEKITKAEVSPLDSAEMRGQISDELTFVLAAPIFNPDGSVWGTVDFDASTPSGQALLSDELAEAAIFQLAQHLQAIIASPF